MVEVAEGDGQGVGGVGRGRDLGQAEQRLDHVADLLLGRAPRPGHRLLDLWRGVGGDLEAVLGGQQQHHPRGLADGHGRAHVGVEEQPLDGQGLGPVSSQDLPQPGRQLGQARRHLLPVGVDGAEADSRDPAAAPLQHRPAAAAEPGVDPEHPHGRPPLLEQVFGGSLPPAWDTLKHPAMPGLVRPRSRRVGPRPTPEGRQDAARYPAVDHHHRAAGAVPVQPPSRPPVADRAVPVTSRKDRA